MTLDDLGELPDFPLPFNYYFTFFEPGLERPWAEIATDAGEFATVEAALDQLQLEFGEKKPEFSKRSIFLRSPIDEYIGTATAWYSDDFMGSRWGRLHWVSIRPAYQGKKLGKPLVRGALDIMRKFHSKVYLTTQTTSFAAIKIYLQFGFEPLIRSSKDREIWENVENVENSF